MPKFWLYIGVAGGVLVSIATFSLGGLLPVLESHHLVNFAIALAFGRVGFTLLWEGEANGPRSAKLGWQWWPKLLAALTVWLVLRGLVIYLALLWVGKEAAIAIATLLTATDPIAALLAILLAGVPRTKRMIQLFWLLAAESMLNDFEAALLFESLGLHEPLLTVEIHMMWTLLLAVVLGGLVRILKEIPSDAGSSIATAIVAEIVIYISLQLGASPVGICVLAGMLSDLLGPGKQAHSHWRHHMGGFGLVQVMILIIGLIPWVTMGESGWVEFSIVAALVVSRGVLLFTNRWWGLTKAEVTVLFFGGLMLLAIPSAGSLVVWEHLSHELAFKALRAIAWTWIVIIPTLFVINVAKKVDNSEEWS